MRLVKTQVLPNKNIRQGIYPINNQDLLTNCSTNNLIQPLEIKDNFSFNIPIGANLQSIPSEDCLPVYIPGVYEPIQEQYRCINGDWVQQTTYTAYGNPQYWSADATINTWTRSGTTLTFTVQNCPTPLTCSTIISQNYNIPQILTNVYLFLCYNDRIYEVRLGESVIFNQAVKITSKPGLAAGNLVIPAGEYKPLKASCGCSCSDGRPSPCENWTVISSEGGFRYITDGCTLIRQKAVLPGCQGCDCVCLAGAAPIAFWAHEGAYGGPDKGTGSWSLGCTGSPDVIPFRPVCADQTNTTY